MKKVFLEEICNIKGRIGYRGYSKKDIVEEGSGAISLSPSNIVSNKLIFKKNTYISWEKYEESPEIMVYPGDIIFCKTASVGKTAIVESLPLKTTINPQLVILKDIKCLSKYLYYYLCSKFFKSQIQTIIAGSSIPTLTQKNLGKLKIFIPEKDQQKKIISLMDSTDKLINKLNNSINKMDELSKSIFNEKFLSSDNTKLPLKKLSDISKIIMGQAPSGTSYNYNQDGLPLISGPGDFKFGKIEPKKFTSKPVKRSLKGDIILGIRATIGEKAWSDKEYCIGRGVAVVRPNKNLNNNFIWYLLTFLKEELISKGRGSTFKQVNKADIEDLTFSIPSIDEQNKFSDLLNKINKIKSKQIQYLNNSKKLMNSLYNNFFSKIYNDKF